MKPQGLAPGPADGMSDNSSAEVCRTNDRLLFASDPGFTVADLANWQFVNGSGTNYATGGLEIAYNGYFEIVPVPEPATWLAGRCCWLWQESARGGGECGQPECWRSRHRS